jgi:hypothetical protein
MRRRLGRRTGPSLLISTVVSGVVAVGAFGGLVFYLNFSDEGSLMVPLGGCPSNAFPLTPSSTLNESAGLGTGWPPRTVGCWTTYSEDGSTGDVFRYYTDAGNTPGWTLKDAYPESGTAEFINTTNPKLRVLVGVSGKESALFWRPGKTRLDVTICFCDPQFFEG